MSLRSTQMPQCKVSFFNNKKRQFHSIFIMKCERLGQPTRLFNLCSFHRLIQIHVNWCRSSGAIHASDRRLFRQIPCPVRSSATPYPGKRLSLNVLNSMYSACSSSGLLLISTQPLSAHQRITHYQRLRRLST